MQLLARGRFATLGRALALVVGVVMTVCALAVAAPAQAHEPWGAYAWGVNAQGELGTGAEGPEECSGSSASESRESCSTLPIAVTGASGITATVGGGGLGANEGQALALLEGGTVVAWGSNDNGQLGDGTESGPEQCAYGEAKRLKSPCSRKPVSVTGPTEVAAAAAGGKHSVALLQSGKVEEWGELATGGTSDVPVAVAGVSGATAIAAGDSVSLAVVEHGRVLAWGERVGDGSTGSSSTPVLVCAVGTIGECPTGPYLEGVTAVAASYAHRLALLSDGSVVAWGENSGGELGDGTTTESTVPVDVSGLSDVTAISAGGLGESAGAAFSLALLSNHSVKAWGENFEGELGDGSKTGPETCGTVPQPCAKTPVSVEGLANVTAIAAHGRSALALLATGHVMAWGSNEYGTLGTGTATGPEPCGYLTEGSCSTKPVEVSDLNDVKGIGKGDDFALAFGPTLPVVTGVSPDEPKRNGATHVTITGSEFEEALAVKFGSTEAASFTVNPSSNGTIIEAVAPAGTGTVDVTVTTPAGTSATSEADKYYYSRPVVKKLSPRKGPEVGGTKVTITGTGFTGATAVKFGTSNAGYTVKSETEIEAVSPAHARGRVDVTVTVGSSGTSAITRKDRFHYT